MFYLHRCKIVINKYFNSEQSGISLEFKNFNKMKKIQLFLSALLMLISFSFNTNAQNWGNITSGSLTYTKNNVGIGAAAMPADAWLHIYGLTSTVAGTCITAGGSVPSLVTGYTNPELWLDRAFVGGYSTCHANYTPNFMQVGYSPGYMSPGILDVINPSGWLGILTIKPTEPLDVNGNGLIRSSLTVNLNESVGGNLTVTKNATIGQTLTVNGALINLNNAVDNSYRNLNGNTTAGVLSMSAKTASNNGSNIELYGPTHGAGTSDNRSGAIHFCSYGTSNNNGHVFLNFNGSTYTQLMDITNDGSVTVAKNVYAQGGIVDLTMPGDAGWRSVEANTANQGISIAAGGSANPGPGIAIYGHTSTWAGGGRAGDIYYASYGDASGSANYGHLFLNQPNPSGTSYTAAMGIQKNGKVVIGQDLLWNTAWGTNRTPDGYLLYVEKGILTEKLKVANGTDGANWSDFVFNNDYQLMPLNKVESYVKENKHLPEIPSASDVTKDGIDVASMDAKLLQKIEELTLYVIQQQKEIDELKQQQKH